MAKKKSKRKQGHPAKAARPNEVRKDEPKGPPHPFTEHTDPVVGDMTRRSSAIEVDPAALLRARESTLPPGIDPATVERYRMQGLVREVDTIVGGEGEAARMTGTLVDTVTGKIVGTLPGSPASALSSEELSALSGYEVQEPEQEVLTPLQLAASVFPGADASMARLPAERQAEVWSDLIARATVFADELVAKGLAARTEQGNYHATSKSAADKIADLTSDRFPIEERMDLLRAHGIEPLTRAEELAMNRLHMVVLEQGHSELYDRLRVVAPRMGLDADGNIVGISGDDVPDVLAWSEFKRDLRQRAADGERRAAEWLRILKIGMGDLSVTKAGREWHQKTIDALAAAQADTGGLLVRERETPPEGVPIDPQLLAEAIVDHVRALPGGWDIATANVTGDDVELRELPPTEPGGKPGLKVRIHGGLSEMVDAAVKVLHQTPEELVETALVKLTDQYVLASTALEQTGPPIPGDTAADRALSLALQRLVGSDWPDDEPYGVELRIEKPIPLTWVGLVHMVGSSTPFRYTKRLSRQELTALDPKGMHEVLMGWRCQHPTEGTFVRIALNALARDHRYSALVLQDVSPATWEALCGLMPSVPVSRTVDVKGMDAGFPEEYRLGTADRPRWAGARAFDKVWDECTILSDWGNNAIDRGMDVLELLDFREYEAEATKHVRGAVGYAQSGLAALMDAQEVLASPDQVNAMPGFESWEQVVNYARDAHLPFESTFLDFEGPAGSCAIDDSAKDYLPLVLRGAHVARDEGKLTILPFGAVVDPSDQDAPRTYHPMGMVVFDEPQPNRKGKTMWATQQVLSTGYMHQSVVCDATAANRYKDRLPFTINLDPSGCTIYTTQDAEGFEVDPDEASVEVGELLASALIVLKTLWLLDMSNVEVVQAPLPRPARRQAERKGVDIALAVHVHTSSKRYVQRNGNGNGEHVEYSHRFRVRGHVKHYPPGTKMADARPDLVKPCPRCGRCRPIWTPPFIKGPDDKPLILKSLVIDE